MPSLRCRHAGCSSPHASTFDQAQRFTGFVAGKNLIRASSQMAADKLAQHIAEIGSNCEIALLVKLFRLEARPSAVNFAATHRSPERHHHVSVSVIGAATAVFSRRPAELRHCDE